MHSMLTTRVRLGLGLAATLLVVFALPAVASAAKYALVVHKVGKGTVECEVSGNGTPGPCASSYAEGTELILRATPSAGYVFIGWTDEYCSFYESEPCELTIEEEPVTVTAEFGLIPKYALTVKLAGSGKGEVECEVVGSGTVGPCASTYLEGTELALYATPNSGSIFVEWSDEYCFFYGSEPCELTIEEEPVTVTAEFGLIPKYALTVKLAGSGKGEVECEVVGSGTVGPCASTYLEGTELALYAAADPGSEFVEWSGDCLNETCALTIEEPATVTATFKARPPVSFVVIKAGTGTGTVTCNAGTCASSYSEGTKVKLAASAAAGSTFSGFSGGDCSGVASCVVTIKGPTTVTATFNANPQPTCATNASLCPPPPPGKARVAGSARFKGGNAALTIICSGGACKGGLMLTAKVKQGRKTRTVVIGKAPFSLADGASTVLKVKLLGAAKQVLGSGKSLKAKLTGTSIIGSTVKITPSPK